MHYTQINLSPNTVLSTQQRVCVSHFRVTSLFDSVCVVAIWWVCFRQICQLELDLQFTDYNV